MKVTALIENKETQGLSCEHGLAVYIEYNGKKYLLDAGQTGVCFENADKLGIPVEEIDTAFLSHAHYDHSGGLGEFFRRNQRAKLYLRRAAVDNRYYKITDKVKKDNSFSTEIIEKYRSRFVFVRGDLEVEQGVYLLEYHLPGLEERSKRACMYQEKDGILQPDRLDHEQTLVFESKRGLVILNSCCHGGVEDVVRTVQDFFPGKNVAAVIGGFHLMGVDGVGTMAGSREDILKLADKLKELGDFKLYTGHCTGIPAYRILKEALGDRISYFSAGTVLEF
ncbi:MAG: MBL fold metallo-hydrolase [Ruminococcus sp.]|jgi:7,8-dihydropterin-6-yl-methyl-4-(beta-D-ribofuranosyl)aminobenzene 5'-phosphate synthase